MIERVDHALKSLRVLLLVCLLAVFVAPTSLIAAGEFERYAHEEGICDCLLGRLERLERGGAIEAAKSSVPFDEATGRDLRRYPPDRRADYKHMKLELWFEDLNSRSFTGRETLTLSAIGAPLDSLKLNAENLAIKDVTLSGSDRKVEHYSDEKVLSLRFETPLPVDEIATLVIDYSCTEPIDGMFFTPSREDMPDYTAEVHTQGQQESNRFWFPCHDYPNERLSTELIVTVPGGLQVSSNGKLVSHVRTGDREVWHYMQDKPHVNYLVSLIIGEFDVVELPHDSIPMQVWVPRGKGDLVEQTYGRTGRMIDTFEKRFGVPYPWARYDQLVVKNFGAGGMENTSATTMYPTAIYDERALLDSDLDSLIAHELAHQWTGDLITCRSWAHIWLNEGWATYGEAIWFEERDGVDGYLDDMLGNFRVARRDRTTNDVPMVSIVDDDPGSYFGRAANPYSKGSSILHMLRMMLGDDVFWRGVQTYMNRHAGGLVETNDFRYAMEEVSGLGLEWFFDQWCYRPGCPDLLVTTEYDGTKRELSIEIVQQQQIDARTPAFRFTLPVHVITDQGEEKFAIEVSEKQTTFRKELAAPPRVVAIDPYLHVLKSIKETKPTPLWIAQGTQGPQIAARRAAVQALSEVDTGETVELLKSIVSDESLRHTLRSDAVRSLSSLGSQRAKDALITLAETGVKEARVRSSLVGALGEIDDPRVIELLAKAANEDESYSTRTAAINGLAERKSKDHIDLLLELVHYDSQHQRVRTTALSALAELEEARALPLAIQYSKFGNTDRARSSAIRTLGQLAKHDLDTAVPFLISLLDDPEQGPRGAAIGALGPTKDKRAEEPLQAIMDSDPDPSMRRRAERAIEQLNAPAEEADAGAGGPTRRGGRAPG
jgi:aminopeptidase N